MGGYQVSSLSCGADSEPTTSVVVPARAYQQVKGGACSLGTCEDIPGMLQTVLSTQIQQIQTNGGESRESSLK